MPAFGFSETMLAVIIPATLIASWTDYRRHRVPNWLNVSIVVLGLGAQVAFFGLAGVKSGLLGMLVGFSMLILLWAMHGMGAGDVKLMVAVGAWLGPVMTFYAVLVGALAGGVVALGMIAARRSWFQTMANLGLLMRKVSTVQTAFSEIGSARSFSQSGGVLPYAIPLTIGTWIVLVSQYSGWWEVL